MVEVDYKDAGMRIYGYTVKPLYAKHNRSFQSFFVNGRYVKSLVFSVSADESYKGLVPQGKFPACVLNIEIEPGTYDVNVHPAKLEIKFADDKSVFNGIYFAIKNALVKSGLEYGFHIKKNENLPENQPENADNFTPPKQSFAPQPQESRQAVFESGESAGNYKYISGNSFNKRKEPVCQTPAVPQAYKTYESTAEVRVIGEAFFNYIIAQSGENIVIIDKHAAHERIIYETLKSGNMSGEKQTLLCPCRVMLSVEEFDAVAADENRLNEMGFSFDFSTPPFLVTTAVPIILERLDMDGIIPEIAQNIYENKVNPQTDKLDMMYHSLACKAAMKANDKNSLDELTEIAKEVCGNPNIRHCPHGRPVMFIITAGELKRQFLR
jgi:DNA mismatch repair protein MutL